MFTPPLSLHYPSYNQTLALTISTGTLWRGSCFLATWHYAENALIVRDHFHVKAYLSGALEDVRKQELAKAMKDKSQEELTGILYCKQRFILGATSRQGRNLRRFD